MLRKANFKILSSAFNIINIFALKNNDDVAKLTPFEDHHPIEVLNSFSSISHG